MPKFDLEQFARTAERVRKKAEREGRLINNPSEEELRVIVENNPEVRKTKYGSFVVKSEPTSRAAAFTKNSVDYPFGDEELKLLSDCEKALAKEKLISIDRIVGNSDSETIIRLTVPQQFAPVAYGGKNLFIPPKKDVEKPIYEILMFYDDSFEANKSKPLPQKDITIRLAMLDDGRVIKVIRNSSYIGEYKKGVFASEDWSAKTKRDGIFLHAGCREDFLQMSCGEYKNVRSLVLALSANGKTTLTSKVIARKEKEISWLIQDDGGALMPDGSFHGFEAGGIYVKTEGLDPGSQLEIYYGLLKPGTFCENVYVAEDGDFDFYDLSETTNGRAIIRREDFMHASSYIDVDRIDNLILITRGPLVPAISKLTLEQATIHMILGQSMESSAGDPTQAGKIKNEFFYDPFMAGNRVKHANRFYEILKELPHINYYLINTGGIGEEGHYRDIVVGCTMSILDSLLRGALVHWLDSPTGFKVAKSIRGIDSIYMHPEKLYLRREFERKQGELNRKRLEVVESIGSGLYPEIEKQLRKEWG